MNPDILKVLALKSLRTSLSNGVAETLNPFGPRGWSIK